MPGVPCRTVSAGLDLYGRLTLKSRVSQIHISLLGLKAGLVQIDFLQLSSRMRQQTKMTNYTYVLPSPWVINPRWSHPPVSLTCRLLTPLLGTLPMHVRPCQRLLRLARMFLVQGVRGSVVWAFCASWRRLCLRLGGARLFLMNTSLMRMWLKYCVCGMWSDFVLY